MDVAIRPVEGGTAFEPTVAQARTAAAAGIDRVYLGEHHGYPDAPYWPSPLLGLSALAAHTERIGLGTDVAVLALYHPVRLAGQLAQLRTVAGPRLRIGVGAGWRAAEFDAFGVDRAERGRRTTEHLRTLRALFADGPTTLAGNFGRLESFELTPAVDDPPALWVGGRSEPAVRRAAALGDGWLAPSGPIDRHRHLLSIYREHGGERVAVNTNGCVVREDAAAVEDAVRSYLVRRNRPYVRGGKRDQYAAFAEHFDDRGVDLPRETPAEVEAYTERLVDFLLRDGLDAFLENELFVAGTPTACAEQVAALADRTGADEVILRLHVAGWPVAEADRTLELLSEDVLPSL